MAVMLALEILASSQHLAPCMGVTLALEPAISDQALCKEVMTCTGARVAAQGLTHSALAGKVALEMKCDLHQVSQISAVSGIAFAKLAVQTLRRCAVATRVILAMQCLLHRPTQISALSGIVFAAV